MRPAVHIVAYLKKHKTMKYCGINTRNKFIWDLNLQPSERKAGDIPTTPWQKRMSNVLVHDQPMNAHDPTSMSAVHAITVIPTHLCRHTMFNDQLLMCAIQKNVHPTTCIISKSIEPPTKVFKLLFLTISCSRRILFAFLPAGRPPQLIEVRWRLLRNRLPQVTLDVDEWDIKIGQYRPDKEIFLSWQRM